MTSELTSNWMTLSTSRPPVWRLRTFFAIPLVPLPMTPRSSRSSSVMSELLVLGLPLFCACSVGHARGGWAVCGAERTSAHAIFALDSPACAAHACPAPRSAHPCGCQGVTVPICAPCCLGGAAGQQRRGGRRELAGLAGLAAQARERRRLLAASQPHLVEPVVVLVQGRGESNRRPSRLMVKSPSVNLPELVLRCRCAAAAAVGGGGGSGGAVARRGAAGGGRVRKHTSTRDQALTARSWSSSGLAALLARAACGAALLEGFGMPAPPLPPSSLSPADIESSKTVQAACCELATIKALANATAVQARAAARRLRRGARLLGQCTVPCCSAYTPQCRSDPTGASYEARAGLGPHTQLVAAGGSGPVFYAAHAELLL